MAAVFDTLSAARELEAAGMERRQAETAAKAAGAERAELVTKADLKAELAALEARLTWRMIALVLAANAATIAAVGWMLPRV